MKRDFTKMYTPFKIVHRVIIDNMSSILVVKSVEQSPIYTVCLAIAGQIKTRSRNYRYIVHKRIYMACLSGLFLSNFSPIVIFVKT